MSRVLCTIGSNDRLTVSEGDLMAQFKLKRSTSAAQPYYFTVVSPGNGRTLATSETYTTKEAAINGMSAIHTAMQSKAEYDDET